MVVRMKLRFENANNIQHFECRAFLVLFALKQFRTLWREYFSNIQMKILKPIRGSRFTAYKLSGLKSIINCISIIYRLSAGNKKRLMLLLTKIAIPTLNKEQSEWKFDIGENLYVWSSFKVSLTHMILFSWRKFCDSKIFVLNRTYDPNVNN